MNIDNHLKQNAFSSNSSERFIVKPERLYFCLEGRADIFISLNEANTNKSDSGQISYICSVNPGEMFCLSSQTKDLPAIYARCINFSKLSVLDPTDEVYEPFKKSDDYHALIHIWHNHLIENLNAVHYNYIKDFIDDTDDYHNKERFILNTVIQNEKDKNRKHLENLSKTFENDRLLYKKSATDLTSLMSDKTGSEQNLVLVNESALINACKILCHHLHIEFTTIHDLEIEKVKQKIDYIANKADFKIREFNLEEDWWKNDLGSFLGFNHNNEPCVLISRENNAYDCINAQSNEKYKITHSNFSEIRLNGYYFYRPFPKTKVTLLSLFRFSASALSFRLLLPIISTGIIAGLLSALIPVITGSVIDTHIPERDYQQFYLIFILFVSVGVSAVLFNVIKSLAVGKIEFKLDNLLQSALWSRLVDLPVSFFRKYSSGEIGKKVLSFYQIKIIISSILTDTLLSFCFSIFYLLVLFFYNSEMAIYAISLSAILLVFMMINGALQIKFGIKKIYFSEQLMSFLSDIINGIGKIRLNGAEKRVFYHWGQKYKNLKKYEILYQKLQLFNSSFMSIFAIVSSMLVFWLTMQKEKLSVGDFIAFNSSFISFQMILLSLSSTTISISYIYAILQNIKPVLEEIPEKNNSNTEIESIKGDIELSNVNFRYSGSCDLVIKDFSLKIHDGEYVAIVGSSGSGKSTLFRLILGFEKAESGKIYISNYDLEKADMVSLRKQTGVVLQNGRLLPGDILSNIKGNNPDISEEDVWKACEMAEIKKDIEEMPMKLFTNIDEKSATISGGQKQRILIAKALIHQPKILLLDEATSALDNYTQKMLTQTLSKLKCTRIVIAHRLSTVIDCEKIIVLEKGRIVEQGNYKTLMEKKGRFYDLVERQIL
ncbi:MAG: NHLP bacteriocin export ABC transporter permease/ATPase subunit [Candidatus Cloacimonetes bacterium]|nr:NHLP bacteriocin export ABC transporter permease/ATPase subunit [Candidatus Cloacimonadota bacterium]